METALIDTPTKAILVNSIDLVPKLSAKKLSLRTVPVDTR